MLRLGAPWRTTPEHTVYDAQEVENAVTAIKHTVTNGGATLDRETLSPRVFQDGYLVSLKGYEHVIPFNTSELDEPIDFVVAALALIDYQRSALNHQWLDGSFIGLWLDGDSLYFDASVRIEGLHNALSYARENEQKAIFDCANASEIRLGRD